MSSSDGGDHRQESYTLPGELFVLYRKRSGWNQAEVARRLELKSERTIRAWESSVHMPTPDILRRLIALYVRERIFLPGEEMQEARRLWDSVKNYFDSVPARYAVYPVFDVGWFHQLQPNHPPRP